ncbi:MAG: gamma carbonic anhydrase family protein [Oscillospiraceae bacterium]|nr:gamma carbonic anhydrase family protein [Oscillospiraceae bacterium]
MIVPYRNHLPQVHPEAFVAENAALVGNVTLEKDSSVWFGAVVRGDNGAISIGAGSNVQDNATLHCHPGCDLTVGKNVTIGHNAVVHCSKIGDNCLIGMGSVVMDGCVLGRCCVVGAGAVVTQNTVVPDGTMLLGVPAKPVKTLSAQAMARLEEPSEYVLLAAQYRQ